MTELLEVGRPGQPGEAAGQVGRIAFAATTRISSAVRSGYEADTIELSFRAHYEDRAWCIVLFGDEIEAIHELIRSPAERTASLHLITVYANSHY